MAKPRKRRTYKEIFMDELEKLSNGEQKFIGNKTLRDELGWDEDGYNWTKEELKNEKKVIVGQGRGGSVALAKSPGVKGLSVFISYSHADESLKNELVKHLKPLERLGLIATWHDRKLKAGEEWDHVISKQLEDAELSSF